MSNGFGHEVIEPMLAMLSDKHLLTLLKYPADAVTRDLPNLVFFNRDCPENQTVTCDAVTHAPMVMQGRVRGRWSPPKCPLALLKAVGRHFKKIVEQGRRTPAVNARLTFLEQSKLTEYIRAIDTGMDVVASEFCPYVGELVDGRISVARLAAEIAKTVQLNCCLEVGDWIRTRAYADENLLLS